MVCGSASASTTNGAGRPSTPGAPGSSPRRRRCASSSSEAFGGRQPGEVGDHGLEVQQRLEPALADLRLVRRVGGVPGRVLQHVAPDHRRGDACRGSPGRSSSVSRPCCGRRARAARASTSASVGGRRRGRGALGDADAAGDGRVDQRRRGEPSPTTLEHARATSPSPGPMWRRDEARRWCRGRTGLADGSVTGAPRRVVGRTPPPLSRRPRAGAPELPARAVLAPERFRGGLPLRRSVATAHASVGPRGLSRTGSISGRESSIRQAHGAARARRDGPSAEVVGARSASAGRRARATGGAARRRRARRRGVVVGALAGQLGERALDLAPDAADRDAEDALAALEQVDDLVG